MKKRRPKKDFVAIAQRRIEAQGWEVALKGRRLVATRRIIEDDHSVTTGYESSFTMEDLLVLVDRRERETRPRKEAR